MKKINPQKKVILGLSGGVDSSVAALLLIARGYQVEGLYMRNWDSFINNENNFQQEGKICPQEEDYEDAKKIAKQLNIKLHRADFIDEYWNDVFKYFIDEYKKGRTPNPDILCNKYIKFSAFRKYALNKLQADYIATGHYAEIITDGQGVHLFQAKDKNKDQTYFLCNLNKEQLERVLFPLADLTKEEVRTIAKEHQLITANKKDSTGICFIGKRDLREFLENYVPNMPGDVIDIKTHKKVGSHVGIMYYTIGQRRGLNLGGNPLPYFVVDKNYQKRVLYVAADDEAKYLYSQECVSSDFNWINHRPSPSFSCQARFRHRQPLVDVKVNFLSQNNIHVSFHIPVRGITPGQYVVLYLNGECLGGGSIDNYFKK